MSNEVSQNQRTQTQVLELLRELGGELVAEEDIIFSGSKMILPEKMTLHEAIIYLREKQNQDEQPTTFTAQFNYRPNDGAHATMAALKRVFGMVTQRAIMTMFGPEPPELRTINVGPNQTAQVPWGRMAIPALPGANFYLQEYPHAELGRLFQIVAQGPRKYRFEIEGVFKAVEAELESNSIYKGKAINGQEEPEYLDLSGVDANRVVYSEQLMTQLNADLWSLLTHTQVNTDLGLSLKRAVLFEGPYGSGKSLSAYLTAQKAVANGWTFLMCRPGRDKLPDVMATARLYQPAVVFFEDVDVISGQDETRDAVSQLLDIFDGITAKGTKILCVLTTNHVGQIHKGALRPGRVDSIIRIGDLDGAGIRKLVEVNVPAPLLDPAMDWDALVSAVAGFSPAFVKEAIDRAIRYAIVRSDGPPTSLTTADFVNAAHGLRPQLELMNDASDERAEISMDDLIESAAASAVEEVVSRTSMINRKLTVAPARW